jgi:MacB-like protein
VGCAFTIGDTANAPGVTIIDEGLARRFWPEYPDGENPIGQHLLVGSSKQPLEIVGIAASVRQQGRDADPMPGFYVPNAQQPPQAASWWSEQRAIHLPSPIRYAARFFPSIATSPYPM